MQRRWLNGFLWSSCMRSTASPAKHCTCNSSSEWSGRCRFSGGSVAKVSAGQRSNRVLDKYAKLWTDLFSDSSQWWDNRTGKSNPRFPDFIHKQTGEALWLIDERNPPLVAERIASLTPGLSIFYWAQKLSGYNKAGQHEKTMKLFEQMKKEGMMTDGYVFVHVLNACAALRLLTDGRHIHRQIIESGHDFNVYVSSALVDMYAKCGSIEDAWSVFHKMSTRDVAVWNAMILGSVKCGQGLKALQLFQQMQMEDIIPNSVSFVGVLNACASVAALEEGTYIHNWIVQSGYGSNVYVGNSLVHMYLKCGKIEDAWKVLNKMPKRSVVSWNTMIQGCVKCGEGPKALEVFHQMQRECVLPDTVTFVGVLNACASIAALDEGRRVHKQIIQSGFECDISVGNSLVDMYAKCGSIDDARRVFRNMPILDVVGWNAMIMGYAIHGHTDEAVALFEEMFRAGSEMDEVTFICLLSACSHGGLVKEGLQYFESMRTVYGVSPTLEHYSCMVDIYGRSGLLEEAEEMVKSIPFEASATAWMSLLGACKIHGNVELGERAFSRVLQLEPKTSASYVLLSNIYGSAGRLDSKAMVQEQRLKKGVLKQPGLSWIEVNNELHSFVVNDSQHPQIEKIREELGRLAVPLKESGYVADIKVASHNAEEVGKGAHPFYHSEKLAISFGLISTPAGAPLRIVKNLRVCADCHNAIKFFAKVVEREITVRDANRFHHFKDGLCTCGDFW